MNSVLSRRMLEAFPREPVWFQLLLREDYTEPRYAHLWQGWLDLGFSRWVNEYEEPVGLPRLRWRGPRLRDLCRTEVHWDESYNPETGDESIFRSEERTFCGWRELFFPVNKRSRLVPVGERVSAIPEFDPAGCIRFGTVLLFIPGSYFDCSPVRTVEGLRGFNSAGEQLMDIPLPQPLSLHDGDTVHAVPEIRISAA